MSSHLLLLYIHVLVQCMRGSTLWVDLMPNTTGGGPSDYRSVDCNFCRTAHRHDIIVHTHQSPPSCTRATLSMTGRDNTVCENLAMIKDNVRRICDSCRAQQRTVIVGLHWTASQIVAKLSSIAEKR